MGGPWGAQARGGVDSRFLTKLGHSPETQHRGSVSKIYSVVISLLIQPRMLEKPIEKGYPYDKSQLQFPNNQHFD